MKADLHIHSEFSDVKQWSEEIVAQAKKMNFKMLVLTDHDTMEGVDRFMNACFEHGITGIPAVEIDYDENQFYYKSELLGYFPNGRYTQTMTMLNDLQKIRNKIASEAISIVVNEFNRTALSFNGLIKHKLKESSLNTEALNISITKPDILSYFVDENVPIGYGKKDYKIFKTEFFNSPVFKK